VTDNGDVVKDSTDESKSKLDTVIINEIEKVASYSGKLQMEIQKHDTEFNKFYNCEVAKCRQ
jgi:hypothetical protein